MLIPSAEDWYSLVKQSEPPIDDPNGDHARWQVLSDWVAANKGDHEAIVTRSTLTHATASALVISNAGVLLHWHKKLGRWLQPGGHIDADEFPGTTAIRETLEETGIVAHHPAAGPTILHVDDHPSGDHRHLDVFFALFSEPDEPHPGEGESPHVKWVAPEDVPNVVDRAAEPRLMRAIAKALELNGG